MTAYAHSAVTGQNQDGGGIGSFQENNAFIHICRTVSYMWVGGFGLGWYEV